MTVRVRFAPSPTGFLHIGGARTALFNWLFARKHGGQFVLRIEDTDRKRFVAGAEEEFMRSLRWLGFDWDEGPDVGGPFGPYRQSERTELYQTWAEWLLDNGFAFKCFCTAERLAEMREAQRSSGKRGYDGLCRRLSAEAIAAREAQGLPYTIRFKTPQSGETTFHDEIRGEITFANDQIDDAVLLKSDGYPTYHLANVVDDHFMEITHIMRADEWINTAPLHVNLYAAFGWEMPRIAHLPVVLSPSGSGKLSKRDQAFKDGEYTVLVQVREFVEAGYPPEAVVNFLTNVGWSFGDDRELFTSAEAMERFELDQINPAPTRLPFSKLDWISGQYIQSLPPQALAERVQPYLAAAGYDVTVETLLPAMPAMSTRLKRYTDAEPFLRFLLVPEAWSVTVDNLTHKKMDRTAALTAFRQARDLIVNMDTLTVEALGDGLVAIGEAVTNNGKAGPLLGTLRAALTGQKVSPPLYESIIALGRDVTVARLEQMIETLRHAS